MVILTIKKKAFNMALSSTRIIVEHAFGRLKNRWRRLKSMDINLDLVPRIILCACLLHNICEDVNDECIDECDNNMETDSEDSDSEASDISVNGYENESAIEFRDGLANLFTSC